MTSAQTPPWTGIFPATMTMFDSQGELDLDASSRHIASLVADGANGIVVAGTTGEFVALTARERTLLVEAAVEATGAELPVIAGTGAYSTAETISMTADAAAAGADAALVILPYYHRPSRVEVMEHFRTVARASPIPIFVYNNPTNSATAALEPGDVAELSAGGFAAGIKSTMPTVHQVHELRAAAPDSFRVFLGSFMAPLEGLAGGAHGWISGILNVALPDALVMYDCVQKGDLPGAREAWRRILPIKQVCFDERVAPGSDIAIYRAILEARGRHGGHSRLPLRPLDDTQRATLAEILPAQLLAAHSPRLGTTE